MGFAINQVIGHYKCLGIIDKPKAGVTYKVRNLTSGEVESLRALPAAGNGDRESAERLLREIRIQTRLSHPNIVEFHDAFELEGNLVMTTEFVEAPTLAEVCRSGPLPPDVAVRAIIQVLDGLEQAHSLGILHRGITAEHVALGPDGVVKLSGFDLAKPATDMKLTRIGTLPGDPRYMPPERIVGNGAPDSRSDLYSVGILLYQTLTGKVPFEAKQEVEILTAQVRTEPVPPSQVNPAIPSDLDRIVLTALRKDPNQRFADAKQFRDALAAFQPEQPAPIQPAPAREAPRPPAARWVYGLVVIAVGAALVIWLAVH